MCRTASLFLLQTLKGSMSGDIFYQVKELLAFRYGRLEVIHIRQNNNKL